jgi:hypothetical protein
MAAGVDMPDEPWRAQLELQRDLNAAKRRALDVAADARVLEDQWLREAADDLAAVLARFYQDDAVWRSLQRGQVTLAALHASERPDVRMLLDVDFAPFLEAADYEEPPPLEAYAWSFKVDVVRALQDPGLVDLDRLRHNVGNLARRLRTEGPDGGTSRRKAWAAALRHGAVVAGRAALIAAAATSATILLGPFVAPLGAGVASVVLEAAKAASAAALEDVVPPGTEPDVRIGPTTDPFDVAATRLAHWLRPDRIGAQEEQARLLRAALHERDDLLASRLHRQQVRWASGALAAALLASDAGRRTAPRILDEVDEVADVLATMLDALTELDLDAFESSLDRLAGPDVSVLDYHAHDVPEVVRERYLHAARGVQLTLDRMAIDGVELPAEPVIIPAPDGLDW